MAQNFSRVKWSQLGTNGTDERHFTSTVSGGKLTLTSGIAVESVRIGTGTVVTAVTTSTTALNVDASLASNALSILGNAGVNTLTRSIYADTLNGGSSNGSLIGGAGHDIPTCGAGADTVVFKQLTGIDHISLSKTMFTMLGAVGTLGSTAFYAAAGATTGHLATDRVIYNTTTGALYYDADGNGSGAAVQIGVLDGHPTLAYTDVLIF